MMNFSLQDYNSGLSIISHIQIKGVKDVIKNCNIRLKRGSIPLIHDKLHTELMSLGWSPEVQIDPNSKISITSIRDNIGLCIQTGNMSRMYADLLKLQTTYLKKIINAGVYIVPNKTTAKVLGDNIAHYERLLRELKIFQNVVTVPLIVFGFHE